MGTNRAEELAKELSERLERLCEGLAISGDSPSKETILNYFNELNNYRQSEIDELTNANKQAFLRGYESINSEVEIIKEEHAKQLDELTKEVERLRKEREWISVYRSDIQIPIDTPILCKQKAKCSNFTYLILGMDKNGEFRDFNNEDYIGTTESELYTEGHYPYVEFWQPLPSINH